MEWQKKIQDKVVYNFNDKLKQGEDGENWLDQFFAPHYNIVATPTLQHFGIDRIFTDDKGIVSTIEYKNDTTANVTGNAFIELVSNDIQGKLGWAFTCKADYIIYRVVGGNIYRLRPSAIFGQLVDWNKYERRTIRNKSYCSVGLLVPLSELEHIAAKVYKA